MGDIGKVRSKFLCCFFYLGFDQAGLTCVSLAQVKTKEATRLIAALEGDGEAVEALKERGFTVAGTCYALNRIENLDDEVRYLIGRCKETGTPSRGVVVTRTSRTLIFGVHDPIGERRSFEQCAVSIYRLGDMLSGMGF